MTFLGFVSLLGPSCCCQAAAVGSFWLAWAASQLPAGLQQLRMSDEKEDHDVVRVQTRRRKKQLPAFSIVDCVLVDFGLGEESHDQLRAGSGRCGGKTASPRCPSTSGFCCDPREASAASPRTSQRGTSSPSGQSAVAGATSLRLAASPSSTYIRDTIHYCCCLKMDHSIASAGA